MPIIPFHRTWLRADQHGQVFVRDHNESNLSPVAHHFAFISRLNGCKLCLYNTNVKVTEWGLACPTLYGGMGFGDALEMLAGTICIVIGGWLFWPNSEPDGNSRVDRI